MKGAGTEVQVTKVGIAMWRGRTRGNAINIWARWFKTNDVVS